MTEGRRRMTEGSGKSVELLGAAASTRTQDVVVTREPRRLLLLAGVMIGFVALGAGLVSVGNARGEEEESIERVSETSIAPEPDVTLEAGGLSAGRSVGLEFVPWPDPPSDHDPHVLGYPGSGQQLLGRESNTVLVYVNSIGRPTVIDLDSGSILEVDISDGRSYDQFSVEAGGIVAFGVPRENADLASERAITFHVYAADAGVSAESLGNRRGETARAGPALCRSQAPCEGLRWSANGFSNGSDSAERLAADSDEALAELLSGDWPVQGRFLLVDVGETSTQRMPIPADDDVWVIRFSPERRSE